MNCPPPPTHTHTKQDLSGLKDILYNNLQRDRGLRAVLEAVTGTMLLLKLQPRLGALFSLVIPSVATITVRAWAHARVFELGVGPPSGKARTIGLID